MPADIQRAIALIRKIHAAGIAIIIVEHIIEVIVSLAKQVIVLHQGRAIANGTPAEITRNPEVIEAYLGKRRAGLPFAASTRETDSASP
jgi:branched-chain amino acid transport system ATP-binding protein